MAQPLNLPPAQGVSDAGGNITIRFGNVPASLAWVATVAVPASTPDIQWTAYVADVAAGSFFGSTPAGPFLVPPNGQLSIKASGLQPATTFQAVINGTSQNQDQAPTPQPQTVATTNGIVEDVLVVEGTAGGSITLTINTQPSWGSIRIFTSAARLVTVVGVQTGTFYQAARLVAAAAYATVVIDPAVDKQIQIGLVGAGGTNYFITAQLSDVVMTAVVEPGEDPIVVREQFPPVASASLTEIAIGTYKLLDSSTLNPGAEFVVHSLTLAVPAGTATLAEIEGGLDGDSGLRVWLAAYAGMVVALAWPAPLQTLRDVSLVVSGANATAPGVIAGAVFAFTA